MSRARLVWWLLALWLALFAWAFVAFAGTEATGDSFLRGINRVGVFLAWQLAGAVPGLLAFLLSRRLARGWQRRLACLPVGLYGAAVLAVLGLVAWSRVQIWLQPPYIPPAASVTAPAPHDR